MAFTKKVSGKPKFQKGPITRQVYETITPGQVTRVGTAGNAGKVGVAALNSVPFGVATTPGMLATATVTGTAPSGYTSTDVGMPSDYVACAREGAFYLLAAGTIADGDFIKCAAAGAVVKWDPATDQANPQLGQCIDPDGATNGLPVLVDLNIQG